MRANVLNNGSTSTVYGINALVHGDYIEVWIDCSPGSQNSFMLGGETPSLTPGEPATGTCVTLPLYDTKSFKEVRDLLPSTRTDTCVELFADGEHENGLMDLCQPVQVVIGRETLCFWLVPSFINRRPMPNTTVSLWNK